MIDREEIDRLGDEYKGTGFGERKGYEVVWMHEPDEENEYGILGGGMDKPSPCFNHEIVAQMYCEHARLSSRAIIMEFRRGAMWSRLYPGWCMDGWEDEWNCWKTIEYSEGEWRTLRFAPNHPSHRCRKAVSYMRPKRSDE